MQTFLPYADYSASVMALDNKRLGKQRVEAWQIYRAITDPDYGWQNHPAVNMWRGYEDALVKYGLFSCIEWINRGHNGAKMLGNFVPLYVSIVEHPPWLGNHDFHTSHQSNLVRKDSSHYGPMFPSVPDNLPYWWPTDNGFGWNDD